jgi:hypothetical protein
MPGNLAVQKWLRADAIQPKLKISQPGDAEEREADRMADHVTSAVPERTVQRKCGACATGGTPCAECDHQEEIAPKTKLGHLSRPARAPNFSIPALRSGGEPLPSSVRAFFEPRFGYDFASVRVHTDPPAAESARAIQARAYTLGHDIVFDSGEWTPHAPEGRHLLAHELTHVIQQQAGHLGGRNYVHRKPSRGVRLMHQTMPDRDVSTIEAIQYGADFGRSVARTLLDSPLHPAWQRLRVWAREQGIEPMAPEIDPTFRRGAPSALHDSSRGALHDSDAPDPGELQTRYGVTGCAVPLGFPYMYVLNTTCSAPCTAAHEAQHLFDTAGCCIKAGIAHRAGPTPVDKALVVSQWGGYISSGRAWFECRAYARSVTCADTMLAALLCWAPAWVVQSVLIGGGAVAGALIGSQVLGAAGAGAGAAGGAAVGGAGGVVAGPPGVVVGAGGGALLGGAAGFVSGEVLGFLGGAAVGAAAGAAASAMREACCRTLQTYRAGAVSQRATNCGAAGGPPICPF